MAEVLVTGGAGFIGSHLVDALIARGDTVRVFDDLSTGKRSNVNPEARLIVGDITDRARLEHAMQDVDAVFHLAAIASVQKSVDDLPGTHRTNSAGTVNVFDCARRAANGQPVPVIYASSAAVYGAGSGDPLHEDAPKAPLTAYGADKLSNELHARAAGCVHGLPSCGFRFFNVYGPRQDPSSPYSGVISIFADRLVADREVTVFGDGEQTRDFIYVDDIVRHLLSGWNAADETGPVFNACSGTATSLNTLLYLMMDATGSNSSVRYAAPRAGDIRNSVGVPTKAQHALRLRAKVSVAAGLGHLIGSSQMAVGF